MFLVKFLNYLNRPCDFFLSHLAIEELYFVISNVLAKFDFYENINLDLVESRVFHTRQCLSATVRAGRKQRRRGESIS